MKILVVSQYFWPESFRINELVDALQKQAVEVIVLTGQPNYPEGKIFPGYNSFSINEEQKEFIKIFRIPLVPRGSAGFLRMVANYISFILFASLLGPWLLRKEKFDQILVYAPSPILQVIPAIVLKRLRNIPLITWVGDLWPESLISTGAVKNPRLLKIISRFVKWIYKNNDMILIQSRPFELSIRKLVPDANIKYLPNPGEIHFSADDEKAPALKLESGFNVVFAGNLGTVQALDIIIEAATLLRLDSEIKFVILGNGSKAQWLKDEIKIRQLTNMSLPGRFLPHEMPAIFRQADALLVSLVDDDTMSKTVPAKVQSYMAAGRPIIASLNGEGARIILESGSGLTCASEDPQALADVILKLKSLSPIERRIMADNGRNYYEKNFNSDILAKQLLGWIADLSK